MTMPLNVERASPTVSTKAIFIMSIIDANENREVAIVHLPGAFLHADDDQHVIMFMKGRLTESVNLIAPQ